MAKTLIIDPPSGWRYGFPRPYDKKPDETLEEWLIDKGYPHNMVDLATKYSRYWEHENE